MSVRFLRLLSCFVAVAWTAGMLWWAAPIEMAEAVIWPIAGVLFGFGWYWVMSRWFAWQGRRKPST